MNDDLWVTASRDTESEDLERRLATARVAAAGLWPFLAAATSEREYTDRKALVRDRIERVAANAAEGDPVLFGVVHTALQEGFDRDFALLHASRVQERREAARRKQAERSGHWTTPHEEYDAGFAAGQADKAAGVEPRVDLTTLYVRGVDSPLAREVGQGPNYWTQGYAKGYETATAAARKQAGVGDWPRVPSQNFPGETVPSCPKCGSTSISIFALPAYQPGTRGMPGGPQLTRCDACGYSDYDYSKGASRKQAEMPGAPGRDVWAKDFGRLSDALKPWVITDEDGWQGIAPDAPPDLLRQYETLRQMGYANGYLARKTAGVGDWPRVPSPMFPGETIPSCPRCGSSSTVSEVLPGSGGRVGDPGTTSVRRCLDCGYRESEPARYASRRTAAGLVPADVQEGDTIRVRFQDKNYLTGEVKGEREYVGTFKFEDSFGIHLDEHTTDGPHTYQNTVSREIPSSSVLSVTKVSARRTAGENPFAKKDDDKAADAPSGDPAAQVSWACPQCQGTDAYTQGGKDLAEALAAKEPIKCGSCGNVDISGAPAATDKPEEKKASRKHAYYSDDDFYDGVEYDTFHGGIAPPLPDEVFRQIESRDPDGGSTEPTKADYDAFEQWIVSTYGPKVRDLYFGYNGHNGYTASLREAAKQAAEGETPMFVVLDADGRVLGMWPTVEEADAMRSTFNGPTTLTQRFYRFSAHRRQAATYDYTRPTFGRDVQVGDVMDIPDAGRARVTGFTFDGDALRYAEVEWLERRRNDFDVTSPIVLGRDDLYSVVAHRRQAANPYQPTANPYVAEPPVSPGMPDDALDGPADNPLTRIEPPRTTRPRQEPSGAPADYSTAPPPAQQAVTQGFASKSMPHLVQGR